MRKRQIFSTLQIQRKFEKTGETIFKNFNKVLDKDVIMDMFSKDKEKAKRLYVEFMNIESIDEFIDLQEEKQCMDEEEAKQLFEQMLTEQNDIKKVIKEFKQKTNLSIPQIAVITGLNKDKVNKILKDA